MSDWLLRDYLVFEATAGDSIPAYTTFLTGHTLVGHVRAENELAAAQAVAGATGRVAKYAVLEVAIVDLVVDLTAADTDDVAVVDETGPWG